MNEHLENQLTAAGREVLDEALSDYKRRILREAANSASGFGPLREISVHDVVAALKREDPRSYQTPLDSTVRLYRRVSSVFYALAFVASIVLVFMKSTSSYPKYDAIVLATIPASVLTGFTVQVLALVGERLRSRRMSSTGVGGVGGYIATSWLRIEQQLRRIAGARFGESVASLPIPEILQRLEKESVLAPRESILAGALLSIRNNVAHRHSFPGDAVSRIDLREIDRLLEHLKDI